MCLCTKTCNMMLSPEQALAERQLLLSLLIPYFHGAQQTRSIYATTAQSPRYIYSKSYLLWPAFRLVSRRQEECLSPSKTFIWNSLYLFHCGDFPQALLSSSSELILPPFCVTFASIGGQSCPIYKSSYHHGNLVF